MDSKYLSRKKKVDIISLLSERGMNHVNADIFKHLEGESLRKAERVSDEWKNAIVESRSWKKVIEEKVRTDFLWRSVAKRKQLIRYLFVPVSVEICASVFSSDRYEEISSYIERTRDNWLKRERIWNKISADSAVRCMVYDCEKIVTGHDDGNIRTWSRGGELRNILAGRSWPADSLQCNHKLIISGHYDGTVNIWSTQTGKRTNMLTHHYSNVAIKLRNNVLVTGSWDSTLAIFDIKSETEIFLRHFVTLNGQVLRIACDEKYTVSYSINRTLSVWNTSTGQLVRNLVGLNEGVSCMKYNGSILATAHFDITLWDVESGLRLRVLEGHESLVHVIYFDSQHLLSWDDDGNIKIWDMAAILDSETPSEDLCLETLEYSEGRTPWFRYEEVEIENNPHYNDFLIWDIFDSIADFMRFIRKYRNNCPLNKPHHYKCRKSCTMIAKFYRVCNRVKKILYFRNYFQ